MKWYSCDACSAQCTFEAMQMCQLSDDTCPVSIKLKSGEIVDRRKDDIDPKFPSWFSYAD